ncbi:MAG: tyrosine-type recombinase/integrase [Proteobacteria bacterium]|nr:tyrosine-type recombinase/integrase [Pseudomonadota bacterium]
MPEVTAPAPVGASPTSLAATVWDDEPLLYERLRRRLASYAPNTQRALAFDWKAWRRWCARGTRQAFPAQPHDLVDYLLAHSPLLTTDASGAVAADHDAGHPEIRRASTVRRWLASLSTLHRIAEVDDPTRHEDVRAARRTILRGRPLPEQKAALRWEDIVKALESLGTSNRDLRARALITVAYSTMARRAELVGIRVEDISDASDGDGTVTLRTKGGQIQERYLAREAREAVSKWLDQAGISEGYVFRRIERHGGVGERTISSGEVARTFKRVAKLLGWDPSRVARVSGHSTRIGAAQDLTSAGASLPEIMLAGGWRSPTMPTHYSRKLSAQSGAMKRWLGTSSKPR